MIRQLDHLIFATNNIAAAAAGWARLFGIDAEPPYHPEGSHLELTRLPFDDGAFLELARPTTDTHRVARFLADRGEGMFSISLEVDDLDATVAQLRSRGVSVSDPTFDPRGGEGRSPEHRRRAGAWPNTRLARIPRAHAHGVAIQLIERTS